MLKVAFFIFAFLCGLTSHAGELKVLVDTSTDMPMAKVESGQLSGSIHKELGTAIAQELRKTPVFEVMPRKRIALSIERGESDLSCQYLPQWLPGDFDWTVPFMPNGVLLITDSTTPAPRSITELQGKPIGTVLGFSYPEIETVLKTGFFREDAPSATLNLQKFVAGRMHHVLGIDFDFWPSNPRGA